MVNSGSFDATGSEGESVKAEFTQLEDDAAEANFTAVVPETAQLDPKPTKTSLQCSVPLDKVKNVLELCNKSKFILENYLQKKNEEEAIKPAAKRLMCLFCDRTFTSNNLKQKHVDRCHSSGQTRRLSSRTSSQNQSTTACCFCSKLNHTDHTLKQLLEHLINEHSNRYYACLPCQERFSSQQSLRDHNKTVHGLQESKTTSPAITLSASEVIRPEKRTSSNDSVVNSIPIKQNIPENKSGFHEDFEDAIHANVISPEEAKKLETPEITIEDLALTRKAKTGVKESKKKISVKSTKNGLRNSLRTTRASVKQINNNFTKPRKNKLVKNKSEPNKEIPTKKSNPSSVFSLVNAYTYKYEKIYDHASDSIKDANSVQFNAIFDKEFYSRTVCNIRENLLNHLDGKLNRNIESETRISNFEHSETESKPASDSVDNFGCDLSLNAVTPVATLLCSSQYGEDFDAQIEYGAKASQKKAKKVAVVKYKFPNKKYNSLFREKDSQNDLTCLDMWTQLSVKKRQHKLHGDVYYSEGLLNYESPTSETKFQVEELNRILDTRGHFEDLRLEADAAQFLELRKKSAKDGDNISEEASKDVYFVLEDLLNKVMCKITEKQEPDIEEIEETQPEMKLDTTLPEYLQLQKKPPNYSEYQLDQTDKIAIICSSQDEKEMKENKRLELSGEWARPRIYICATCGLKMPNLKSLEDHKNVNHPHIWCSHYEFVGNQSRIYRHLSIPGLGKVGVVELLPINRQWQRSNARVCSKCSKHCHNLGELHKHILECGGDWTWMLARKKCKYRPYGARTRRRRQRGYKRSCNPEVNKPKIKQSFIGPRPKPTKPSDAETIQRMLANLPAKRNRKMISMRDGIQRPRKPYKQKLSTPQTSSKSSNKKVHFKNNSSQISKQNLRNALQRKISANNLRKQNKNYSESDNSDTPLTLRSRVKKDTDDLNNIKTMNETEKLIGTRPNIRNKRMISRILGSKIFDTTSALVTRRKIVKAIAQNNLIRRTRLRCKMQQSQTQKDDETIIVNTEEKLSVKNKASTEKTKLNENNSKLIKTADSIPKNSESNPKPSKKSNTKRLLSVLTKSNKKTKVPAKILTTPDKDKPDTINAVIDEVIKASIIEPQEEKVDTEEKTDDKNIRLTRSSSSLLKVDPNESKNNKVEESTENNSEEKLLPNKTKRVLAKKTNKLVQNVKSFRKSFRKPNKNNPEEKSEGITSKLMRTLSIKKKKTKKEANSETIDFKKTTNDLSKKPDNDSQDKTIESVVRQCDIIDSNSKVNDTNVMPILEKIEPLPTEISSNSTSVNSIPVLCPVNVNDTSVEKPKETVSDSETPSEICSEINKTTSDANCNNGLNKFKSKIKRSGRGLNDCIAMLKCKLEQKYSTEPTVVDKSNLFILNSSEVHKHSQPVVQEKEDTNNEPGPDINLKVSEEVNEVANEPQTAVKNVSVLEIPSVKIHSKNEASTSETSSVETQTQTTDEDIVPNAAIDYIPTDLQTNFQLSYVLNATLQNCLMECVKNKCETFKIENQNYPVKTNQNKLSTKIGSVRKRKPKTKIINTEKHIPNIPVLLNTAFTEKIPKKITKKQKDSIKAASDTSDDDVPLSKFVSDSSSCPKLKIKLPVAKKKRSLKKQIAFTPLILNHQDSCIPQTTLQDRVEQQIPVDDSAKNETIQNEISAAEINETPADLNTSIVTENIATESNIEHQKTDIITSSNTEENNISEELNTSENIEHSVDNENIPVDLSVKNDDINKEILTENNDEQIEILGNPTLIQNNNEHIEKLCNETAQNHDEQIEKLSNDSLPELNIEEHKSELNDSNNDQNMNKPEEINDFSKEVEVTKEVIESLPPSLSQQIMAIEDEPCENFLINKTLTEANIKPSTTTKNVLQTNSSSENIEFINKINHFDSGKENTECQDVKKQKKNIKKQKKKRGRGKIVDPQSENTSLEQPIEKNEIDTNTGIENTPQIVNEENNIETEVKSVIENETEPKKAKVKRKRGKSKTINTPSVNTEIEQSIDSEINIPTENIPQKQTEEIIPNNIESQIEPDLEPQIKPIEVKPKGKRGRRKTVNLPVKNKEITNMNLTSETPVNEVCTIHIENTNNGILTDDIKTQEPLKNEIKPNQIKPKGKRGRKKTINVQIEINEPVASDTIDAPAPVILSNEPIVENKTVSTEEKPKTRRGRRKNIQTEEILPESIVDTSDLSVETLSAPELSISTETFKSSLENELELVVMENKTIQPKICIKIKPIIKPDVEKFVASDSEDEVPLAVLIKTKPQNESSILEENALEENSTIDALVVESNCPELFESNEIISTDIIDSCNMDSSLDTESLNISETCADQTENNIIEKEFPKLDNILCENTENNKLLVSEEIQLQINESNAENSTEEICTVSEKSITHNIELAEKEPEKYLETHFNDEIYSETTVTPENINHVEKEIITPEVTEKSDKDLFDVLITPSNKQTEHNSSFITTPDLTDKSLVIKIKNNLKIKIRKPKRTRRRVIPKSLSKCNIKKKEEEDTNVAFLCEICNKTFKRKENLASHKKTLTHIAKLSEIEARECMSKRLNETENDNSSIKESETEMITEKEDDNLLTEINTEIFVEPEQNETHKEFDPENINTETKNTEDIMKDTETKNNEDTLENAEIKNTDDHNDLEDIEINNMSNSETPIETNIELPEIANTENIFENKQSDIEIVHQKNVLNEIEDLTEENCLNEIEDDFSPSITENISVDIPIEEKEIIEIHDESSTDSELIIIPEMNTEPEIIKPLKEILEIETPKQNANLLPGFIVNSNNTNLKLVDIISEVLDKPVNDLNIGQIDYLPQNITRSSNSDSCDKYSEPKRYKSLGERKSFDSDNFKSNDEVTKENYTIGSVNNGLLSKQLSLLENIIEETSPNLNYIDDSMSLSSNQFDEPVQNIPTKDLFKPDYSKLNNPQIKFSHSADVLSSFIKPNNHFKNFENISQTLTKPIEENEEKKKSKENSKRKILNRDEELFLECCSLLKSGSEMPSVTKKKNIPLNNFSRSNDASWTIQKQPNSEQFIQRDSYSWLAQSSRVDTPIGEPFVNNDWSNSNSAVSSEWLAQKAPSPDRPTENNTLLKKSNNNSGETKYSDIQFEDISIDSSLETSKTLMAIDNSNTENIPLDFHNVDFSCKNLIEPEESEGSKNVVESNENSEAKYDDEPQLKIDEDVPNKDEFDSDLKKKVVSAFGGLMAKALSNRLHAVVRRSKKAKGKRDFASALQASITDYAVPVKKNKLNLTDSDSSECPKKMMTKGAMKVFEGLKVSIPTQDLNLKEVLNCTNKPRNGEAVHVEIEPIRNGEIKQDGVLEKNVENPVEENNKNGKIKNLFGRFGNKLGLRETKKKANKHRSKSKNNGNNKKTHDVYEFEESVDSNYMFKTGKFSLFRTKEQNSDKSDKTKTKETEKIDDTKTNNESGISSLKWNGNESDSETDRYYDSMSFEEMSLSSESTHGSDLNLNKTKQIPKKSTEKSKDNQKKCMIMGRIFKNASKPKLEDKIPEIRDISSEENSKLVETYVDTYNSVENTTNTDVTDTPAVPNNVTVVNNSANKMSKIEMDLLFDKLLEEEKKHTENNIIPSVSTQIEPIKEVVDLPPPIFVDQNNVEKKRVKEKSKAPGKTKKRQRHNSEDSSSAEEFTLAGRHSKSSKKHHKTSRKSTKTKKDTGINLEQEMKECIGVAGRKSQRKCTSGKQNVLVEYWSSDESSFEEVIKMLGKEPAAPIEEENKTEEFKEPAPVQPEDPINHSQEIPVVEIVETIPKHTVDIYDFDSDAEPKQESLKIKIKLTEPLPKPEHEFIPTSKIKIPKKTKRVGKNRKHFKSHGEESEDTEFEIERNRKREHKRKKNMENGDPHDESNPDCLAVSRKKRNAGDQLYYWSSSSEDEFQDLIEVKPIREDTDDDRPMQHGWIVGDSPKKLVTMLAQAKGKKVEGESVKEQGKKNRVTL